MTQKVPLYLTVVEFFFFFNLHSQKLEYPNM